MVNNLEFDWPFLDRLMMRFRKTESQMLVELFARNSGLFLFGTYLKGRKADHAEDDFAPFYRIDLQGMTNLITDRLSILSTGAGETAAEAWDAVLADILDTFGFNCEEDLKIWIELNPNGPMPRVDISK